MPRPLYPDKDTPLPFEEEAGWAQSWSGCFGEERSSWLVPGFELQTTQPVAHFL